MKLRHLTRWNEQRRENARRYDKLLADANAALDLPYEPEWSRSVYHLYVVRLADRDKLQAALATRGIGTGIHYPVPVHLLKAYELLGLRRGDFPDAEQAATQVLSLPMYPELLAEQQCAVSAAVQAHIAEGMGST